MPQPDRASNWGLAGEQVCRGQAGLPRLVCPGWVPPSAVRRAGNGKAHHPLDEGAGILKDQRQTPQRDRNLTGALLWSTNCAVANGGAVLPARLGSGVQCD